MAKQFDIDIPLDAAKTLADQTARMSQARIMADRTTESERLLAKLREHKPGSPEYNRILDDIAAVSRAQFAGREDVAAIRDPNYIKAVDRLNMAKMLRDANKDPKKVAEHDEKVRIAEADVATARNRAMSAGGGSTGGAASSQMSDEEIIKMYTPGP
jgi:hypothetical protein